MRCFTTKDLQKKCLRNLDKFSEFYYLIQSSLSKDYCHTPDLNYISNKVPFFIVGSGGFTRPVSIQLIRDNKLYYFAGLIYYCTCFRIGAWLRFLLGPSTAFSFFCTF